MFETELTETKDPGTNGLLAASPSPHALGKDSAVLRQAMNPGVNLALWQREGNARITEEISSLKANDLRDERHHTSLASFDEDVCTLMRQQGLDPQKFRNLRFDLQHLTDLLAAITRSNKFIFRLVTIANDECSRFHLDRAPLRLITTYQGPGTEWLPDRQVDRAALARSASNEAVTRFGSPSRFEQFWVGIMKGDPRKSGQGLVHRSPPVAGTGQIRVLFSLDSKVVYDHSNGSDQ